MRILVLDDEEILCQMLCELLDDNGYEVVSARSGEEGLERFAESSFDLVLADLQMPRLGGVEFLRRIRALPLEPQPKAVVMTGRVTGFDNVDFEGLRIDEAIRKPATADAILRVLHAVLTGEAGHSLPEREGGKNPDA